MVLTETVVYGPDAYFWYLLCGILGTALLGILIWIAVNTKALLEKIVEQMADHETRITVIEKNGNKHKE